MHTTQLAAALAARGHRVAVVELGHRIYEETTATGSIAYDLIHVDLSPDAFQRLGVAGWLQTLGAVEADVVVLVKAWFRGTTLALELALRLRFGRYATIEHHPADEMKPRSTRRHFYGLIPGLGLWWHVERGGDYLKGRMPALIVAVSEVVRRNLVRYRRFPESRIRRVHNGIDTSVFRPDPGLRARVRAKWGVPPEALLFGAVGRLHPIKGYHVAIELFERLVRLHPGRDLRLAIAGLGPELERLRAQADRAGLSGIVLLPGWVEHACDALCALDVFVMPSVQEGLGISLLEAMACGCYPIAMAVGGVPEVLSEPGLGSLVPAADPESFLRAMSDTAGLSVDELQAVGRRAREHVVAHFEARTQFAAIVGIVEDVAG